MLSFLPRSAGAFYGRREGHYVDFCRISPSQPESCNDGRQTYWGRLSLQSGRGYAIRCALPAAAPCITIQYNLFNVSCCPVVESGILTRMCPTGILHLNLPSACWPPGPDTASDWICYNSDPISHEFPCHSQCCIT